MNTKKRNFYNVYQDGKQIASEVTCKEAAEITGCDPYRVAIYAKKNCIYNGPKDSFRITLAKYSGDEIKYYKEVSQTVNIEIKDCPPGFVNRWNEMLELFAPFKKKVGAVR